MALNMYPDAGTILRINTINRLKELVLAYQQDHEIDHLEMAHLRDHGQQELAIEMQRWLARTYEHIQTLKTKLEALS